METIFWDVDTQIDFIDPDGKLAVEGASSIRPNLKKLTEYARGEDRRILGSVDYHHSDDPELSKNPDYKETFPPHCLAGSEGQEKIKETRPRNPLWIDPRPLDEDVLKERLANHRGEVFFRKREFDVFTNTNVSPALELINPFQIVVFGVTLDVCVHYAVKGFLEHNYQVTLVEDATKAIEANREQSLLLDWKNQGVQVITTEDAVSGYVV